MLSRVSCIWLLATLWTVAHQAPLSMGFSRQEYWSGLPFPSPGDLPDPGIKPRSPALQADALTSEPPGKPRTVVIKLYFIPQGSSAGRDMVERKTFVICVCGHLQSFSKGSSQPRDRSQVSHIAGRRFNLWATREARNRHNQVLNLRGIFIRNRIFVWS